MFKQLLVPSALVVVLLALSQPANAGWWDDFTSSVQEKMSDGMSYLRNSLQAAKAVGAKLDQAQAVIDDPDTPDKIGAWFKEASAPVQDKIGELHEFANGQVVPEVKRVVDVGSAIARILGQVKPQDSQGSAGPEEEDYYDS